MRSRWALFGAMLLAGCGYRAVHGGEATERFAVVLVTTNVPDAVASDEVVAGVREELARAGALKSGDAYPRCEVEVLRADESSEGIVATPNADGVLLPDARATRVGIVARAWLVRSKDGPRERDTRDVRASDTVASAADARTAMFRQVDAVRAVSHRVGQALGTRLLGFPTASE
jgi:hypothetical protein